MKPVFGDGHAEISWKRTCFYPLTENYKVRVKCSNCGIVYRAKINERKEGQIKCPGCSTAVDYKFESA